MGRSVKRDYCFTFCTCFEDRHCLRFCQCGSCDVRSCKCETCQSRGPASKSSTLSHERLQADIDSEFARTESGKTRTSSCSISQSIHTPIYQNAFYQTVEHPVTPAGPPKVVELSSKESSTSSTCSRCSKCNKKRRGASTPTCSQGCEEGSCSQLCEKGSQAKQISQSRDRTSSTSETKEKPEVSSQVTRKMTTANEKTRTLSSFSVRSLSSFIVRSQETSAGQEPSERLVVDKSTQRRPNSNDIATQTHSATVANQSTSRQSSQRCCNCSSRPSSDYSVSMEQQNRSSDAVSGSRCSSYGRVEMLINVEGKSRPESRSAPSTSPSPRTPEGPLHLSIRLRPSKSEKESRSVNGKTRAPRSGAAVDEEIFEVRRRQLERGLYAACERNEYYRQYAH